MQKNRVKQALAFHWFGLGSNFRINRLLNETLIKKDNKLECLLSEEEIMTLLELVPLANPISRTHSFEDKCFERLIPYLLTCKYDKPFKYLNTYGWLEKTFFDVLEKEKITPDIQFQRKICEVELYFDSIYCTKFSNLFYNYAKRYTLDESLLKELQQDSKYEGVLNTYANAKA